MKKFTLLAIAVLSFAAACFSQTTTASASQTVTLNLQNQIDLSVTAATGTSFTFASPDDYTNGLTNASASTFRVRSNKPWAVTVKAAAATFTGPTGNAMPSTALGVRLNGGTTFAQLSTTAASLTAGARGTNAFTVDYQANPGFSYDAGTYTLSVVYTASQQ